ncbi:MAG: FlgD immunoglobulin-like domain containing protein [candidate division WOR-3 bacterium]
MRIWIILIGAVITSLGEPIADGGIPGTFLNYGASPRTLALGKSFTGLADDAEAVYYNPAGLGQLTSQDLKLTHSSLYGGSRMEYVGYALPTKQFGTFGITLLNHSSSAIDVRDEENDRYEPAAYVQNCYIFSYAYSFLRFLGLGANFKVVTENFARFNDIGLGGDLGLIVLGPKPFNFGIMAQNLWQPTITLAEQEERYPITIRFGTSVKLFEDRVILLGDLVTNQAIWQSDTFNKLDYIKPHFGIEFELIPHILTHRIGYDKQELSVGLGVRKEWGKISLGVDYALLLHHQSNFRLPLLHKLGLFLQFGGFRTWIDATPKIFSPTPEDKRNVLWMDLRIIARRNIKRWQVTIKNNLGEVVRTFSGWENPPLRMAWDGLDDAGRMVSDGKYNYEIVIVDEHEESLKFSGPLTTIKTKGPEGKIEVERK